MTASLSARKHALRLLILFLNLTAIVSIEESITGRFQYYREKSQFGEIFSPTTTKWLISSKSRPLFSEYTLVILRGGSSASGTNTPLGGEKKNEQEDRQRMSKLDHDDIMEMLKRDRQAALQYLRGDDNPTHAPDSPDTSLSVDRDNNKGSSETMSPEINDNLQAEDDTQENISMNRATVEVGMVVACHLEDSCLISDSFAQSMQLLIVAVGLYSCLSFDFGNILFHVR